MIRAALVVAGLLSINTAVVGEIAKVPNPSTPNARQKAKQQVDSFRGHQWGQARDDAEFDGDNGCTRMDMLRPPEYWCDEEFAMGDVTVTAQYRFADEKLVAVDVGYYPSEYDYVRGVFVEKWGQPTSTKQLPLQNRAGTTYVDDVTIWDLQNVTVEMHRYSVTTERGAAFIVTKAWTAEKNRREKESQKKAKDTF